MQGVSKEILQGMHKEILSNYGDHHCDAGVRMCLEGLIANCQELQESWMTLEEFLKSGFIGKCWVNIAFTSYFADFNGIDFVENPCIESKFPVKHITRVMPIHKPEPPR